MEILKGKAIKIERETQVAGEADKVMKELVGHIPAVTGEFEVEGKSLVVKVCPTDASKRQKVIFEGDAFPTINIRGGRQRQLRKLPAKRRVLYFSAEPTHKVRQEAGENTYLLFSYVSTLAGKEGD